VGSRAWEARNSRAWEARNSMACNMGSDTGDSGNGGRGHVHQQGHGGVDVWDEGECCGHLVGPWLGEDTLPWLAQLLGGSVPCLGLLQLMGWRAHKENET